MDKHSYLGSGDIDSIDELYKKYKEAPETLDDSWRKFFEGFEFARLNYAEIGEGSEYLDKEFKVLEVITWYRKRGHLFTETNPVRTRRKYSPTLDIENFELSETDLSTKFQAGKEIGIGSATLSDILDHLKQTYCKSIGVEYVFIRNPEVIEWLKLKMESVRNTHSFNNDEKKHFYYHLKQAIGFEKFIHKKFVGQKRFSLEGSEALIPALDAVIGRGAELGIEEFIIGMSHRGRLNILANILQKPYEDIFNEFIGEGYDEEILLGDVKYHLGYWNDIVTGNGAKVRLNLVPNPSHLETVGSVVQGIAKAKIIHKYKRDYNKLASIAIHGDAAIASQGIVYELAQMSRLKGYKTGGTIHLVINNQIGFTTNYLEARSSTYCTDIGKVIKAPIFHVNGDDVEALIYTIRLAMEYRQEFHTDVFIDLLSYRKYGHNEGDEPRFTQPLLYKAIAQHLNTRDIYSKKLIEQGVYTKDEVLTKEQEFDQLLDSKLDKAKKMGKVNIQHFLEEDWKGFEHAVYQEFFESPSTKVDKKVLLEIADKMNTLPPDKKIFKKIGKLLDDRKAMVNEDRLDWAMGELLAYGSLLYEGFPVRVSGQDSERGTFSHRHAAFVIEDSAEKYFPLKNLKKDQPYFHIYNSPLSEYGVLGFEYGYALATPNALNVWEAQFGDFHNVAQVIIDQYLSSAEEKWGLKNGLVLLLPHGFEGQGPEHSSARIERFLALSANNNMRVVNCTTPANFFHVLRRQLHSKFRVPLVVFTPKSLLRHPKCVSALSEFTESSFKELIDDDNVIVDEVKRVVFCTGKIYYELLEKKEFYDAKDIALVRLEQLHPFPFDKVEEVIRKYKNTINWLWTQEEPENMGAWMYVKNQFQGIETSHKIILEPITRLQSGTPAVGLNKLHILGQEEIVGKVFRKCDCELKNKYCGLQCKVGVKREGIDKEFKYFK